MARYDFTIHYDGEGLKNNRIPIEDLAPSLLAVSKAFQEIQKLNNPLDDPVSLDIKASEPGSFIVDLVLANGGDIIQRAVSLLNNADSNALLNLKDYVEIFSGLIIFIIGIADHKLKHKKENDDGTVEITLDDNTKITISKKVLDAYQNVEIRKSINDSVKPLSKDGIEFIDFSHGSHNKVTVKKADYRAFEVPDATEKEINVSEEDTFLQIISVAFEHGKWQFSSGGNRFFAKIEDESFLKDVEKNVQQFGSTDVLKVHLLTRQYIDKAGLLKSEYTVLKVLDHQRGGQQIELNFTDPEN
ncbi:hypothetical protein EFP16_01360 [Lactiplantibacillus pentosus]|uniref:hypothetical protein n=1 Tax=Lactiplantibacillus pentosus TaxID=1589 RepID=UPI0021A66909|nr:hypothetical protein [Lactiplantibacillus pentosus]MCT3282207.1 hypothetical protein [Lactiplantibacillus pentosus]